MCDFSRSSLGNCKDVFACNRYPKILILLFSKFRVCFLGMQNQKHFHRFFHLTDLELQVTEELLDYLFNLTDIQYVKVNIKGSTILTRP